MHLPIFENAYFLQSVGWAIANSFWQIGALWLLYKAIVIIDKKLPPVVKHHLSISLLITSFTWFIFTLVENYSLLINDAIPSKEMMLTRDWVLQLDQLNKILPFLSVVYFLLLGVYTIQFVKKLAGNRLLQKSGLAKAPVNFRLFVTHTAIHLGIKRKVQVWISEHVDVPSVTGFIKPVILLPVAIVNHLSIKQVEAVLLHELAHVKRNDYLINLVQSAIELILFFNPFVYLISKAARKERENCCDDWVLNYRYDQLEYASALLVLEEQRNLKLSFALAATNDKKNLLQRIKRLFDTSPQTNYSFNNQIKLVGLCLLLLSGIFFILPVMKDNNGGNLAKSKPGSVKNEQLNFNQVTAGQKEILPKNFFSSQTLSSSKAEKNVAVVKPKVKKKIRKDVENNYLDAFINEELLTEVPVPEPVATLVTDKEMTTDQKYFIKVEEQQSGNKQKNTYFFELNNNNGNTDVKPLIILNEFKVPEPFKKTAVKIAKDSIQLPAKKRVTS